MCKTITTQLIANTFARYFRKGTLLWLGFFRHYRYLRSLFSVKVRNIGNMNRKPKVYAPAIFTDRMKRYFMFDVRVQRKNLPRSCFSNRILSFSNLRKWTDWLVPMRNFPSYFFRNFCFLEQ